MQIIAADRIRVSLLGEFDIAPPVTQGKIGKQLVALLVLGRRLPEFRHNREASRDWLALNLYPEVYTKDRLAARNSLSKALGVLTIKLDEQTLYVANNYLVLGTPEVSADIDDFYNALAQEDYRKAVDLWNGPLLDGRSYVWQQHKWCQFVRTDLDCRYLDALYRLADQEVSKRNEARTTGHLPEKVEEYRQAALKLLSRASEYVKTASQVQQETRSISIVAEKIKRLHENLQAAPDHTTFPQRFRPNRPPTNLPEQPTSFIGREKEIAEIKELLSAERLLTLTGSGGCGKTRLSLQVAAGVLKAYPEGVWFVELASLTDPATVPQTVAEVLSIRETPGEPITKTLVAALKARQMLLVLDNCEHVLDAAARLVDAVLKSCYRVTILVSSREPLGIGGEHAYRVPSLSFPPLPPFYSPRMQGDRGGPFLLTTGGTGQGSSSLDKRRWRGVTPESLSHYEAVRLFVDRARATGADFTVTADNAHALASICYRLDGIPLAIELAAARVRTLPVEQIDARLDNRFLLLTGGSRTALPRQQTLRAAIDWSYDLLDENQKALLCWLSVFAGGWTLEEAEQVCSEQGRDGREEGRVNADALFPSDMLDLLTSLADKSLLVYQEREGKARYRLLETVRQYGRDRLIESGESASVRRRHRDYFLALAEEAEPNLRGMAQAEWFQRLEEEHENFNAALDWSLNSKDESERTMDDEIQSPHPSAIAGLRLCGALQRFWCTKGHLSEGQRWCAEALNRPDAQERTAARAKALYAAGQIANHLGGYRSAVQYHEQSLAIYEEIGDLRGVATSLSNLGGNEEPRRRDNLERSLAILQTFGDEHGIADVLGGLGFHACEFGDKDDGLTCLQECLAIRRKLGDLRSVAVSLNNLGHVAYMIQKDYAGAQAYFEESLEIREQIGDRSGRAVPLHNLGFAACFQNELDAARAYFEESLGIVLEIGDRRGIANSIEAFASLAAREQKYNRAGALWGAWDAIYEEIGWKLAPSEQQAYEDRAAEARQAIGEEAFAAAWAQGRLMTQEQAIDYALEEPDAPARLGSSIEGTGSERYPAQQADQIRGGRW